VQLAQHHNNNNLFNKPNFCSQIVKRERKPTRCNSWMFIINTFSTCFGHHYVPSLNLHPYTNLPITGILPLVHLITSTPHTPPIKQAQRMHQNTRSRYTRPEKRTRQIPVQRYDKPICTRHSHIHTRFHLGLIHTTPQKRHYS